MKKFNLKDMTFVMPVRFDSVIRLENALVVINYLHRHFETNIFVLEAASYCDYIFRILIKNKVRYFFLEENDIIFHKTKYINYLTRKINTPFISIWDADVIADKKQIIEAIEALKNNKADVSYPYDGRFLDTSDIIRLLFLEKKHISVLHNYKYFMHLIYGDKMVGGAVFINLEKYIKSGLDNENFYGWGNEDYERQYRFNKLGYRTYRSDGPIYHLSHPRDINGKFRSEKQYKWTSNYLKNLKSSSQDDVYNRLMNRNSL